jgi:tripartite-type tricarboxylate transporter receptor subunit TctC
MPAPRWQKYLSGPLSLSIWLATTALAIAADYPEKMMQVIVPFAAGTGTDSVARQIFAEIAQRTGQTAIVDNKAGADGQIGAQAVALAKPDGYTIFVTTQTTQAYNVNVYRSLPYDPVKSFAPVAAILRSPQLVLVRKDLPVNTIGELIALAKAEPGKLTFGSGNGSSRGGGELFKMMGHVDLLNVPYKAQTQAIIDLLGGRIDIIFTDMTTGLPALEGGQVRALAVTSRERLPSLPHLPTVDESGLPGFEMTAWAAAYVPAATPRPIVEKLNALIHQAAGTEAYRERMRQMSAESIVGTPEALAALQAEETIRWAEIAKAAGLREQ